MARETYISPQNFVIFKETGIVPTIPDPSSLRKFHANFLDTDLEIGGWARNIKDGKLWFRNETEIIEYSDDLFGPNVSTYHDHDDRYVQLGSGSDPIDISEWFEIVDAGLLTEYLRCKKPFAGDFEIQAWSDSGQMPPTIWDSMPLAATDAIGGIQLPGDADLFLNGVGNWAEGSGGTGMTWPATGGIANYTGSASWGTPYTTSGSGMVLALTASPVFTGTVTVGGSTIVQNGDFELRGTGISDETAVRLFTVSGDLYLQNGSGNNTIFRNKVGGEYARFTNAGRLGISTTTPQWHLDLGLSNGVTLGWQYNNANANSRSWGIGKDIYSYGDFGILTADAQDHSLDTVRIYITNDGNVSLGGFTSPLSTLCINGGLHIGGESAAGDNNILADGNITGISLKTTNWSFEEDGNDLLIKRGTTVLYRLSSTGYFKAKDEVESFVSAP